MSTPNAKKPLKGQHAGIPNMPALTGGRGGECDEEKILHHMLFSHENTVPR